MKRKKSVFIVWKKFQRRVEVLAPYFDLEIHYFHYAWEERSKSLKAFSYLIKSLNTLILLFQKMPEIVFVQIPPTPALYPVAFYSWLAGSRYVSDCHNSLLEIMWSKWIFMKYLLAHGIMVVHNDHFALQVNKSLGLAPFVLRDGILDPITNDEKKTDILNRLHLSPASFVLLPWTFSIDEPILEVFKAAELMPDFKFVMTWYIEKLPMNLQKQVPPNVILTGYLPIDEFNDLFYSAGIALVLTKWEATQLSGMQEAMAFEIPAVVSDLDTTRFLYKDYPVYVKNNPESISVGINFAFQNRSILKEKMKRLKNETKKEFLDQMDCLKDLLNF